MKNRTSLTDPRSRQVGGDHYQQFQIQPVDWIDRNGLSFLAGCVTKRICRWQRGGKGLQDLQKAKHEIDLLMLQTDRVNERLASRILARIQSALTPTWSDATTMARLNGLTPIEADIVHSLIQHRRTGRREPLIRARVDITWLLFMNRSTPQKGAFDE